MTHPATIQTEQDIQRILRWTKIARMTNIASFFLLGVIFATSLPLLLRYPAYFHVILFSDCVLCVLTAALMIASYLYSERHDARLYEPMTPSDMLKMMDNVSPYPDIQDDLKRYLQVRDYLTAQEYQDFLDSILCRTRSAAKSKWSSKRASFLREVTS